MPTKHHLPPAAAKTTPTTTSGTTTEPGGSRSTEGTSKRPAYSLKTPDPESARRKRDDILTAIETKSGNVAA